LVLFIGSEALLAYLGYVQVYFIVFFPVFVSTSALALAPLLFFLLPLLSSLRPRTESYSYEEFEADEKGTERSRLKTDTKFGGFLMIGPVPIIFGKGLSGKVLIILALLMIVLIISWFIFTK
jgi:uncharacterized protein (TIGR00304 family)